MRLPRARHRAVIRAVALVVPSVLVRLMGRAARPRWSHGRWSVLARSPLGPRSGSVFAWDGHDLLEAGGMPAGPHRGVPQEGGAAYDPSLRRWRRVAAVPAKNQLFLLARNGRLLAYGSRRLRP